MPTTPNEPPRRKGREGSDFSLLGVLRAFAVHLLGAHCMTFNGLRYKNRLNCPPNPSLKMGADPQARPPPQLKSSGGLPSNK
jgi:hypothetical protein